MNATTQKFALAVLRSILIAIRRRHQLTITVDEIRNEVFKQLRIVKEKQRRKSVNYIHAALQAFETNKIINAVDDEFDPNGQIRRADRKHMFRLTRRALSWFEHQYPNFDDALKEKSLFAAFYHFNLIPEPVAAETEESAIEDVRARAETSGAAPWEPTQIADTPQVAATTGVVMANESEKSTDDRVIDMVESIKNYEWFTPYTPALLLGALRELGAVDARAAASSSDIGWESHKVALAADVLAEHGLLTWATFSHKTSKKRRFTRPARNGPYLTPFGLQVAEYGDFTAPVNPDAKRKARNPMLKNGKKSAVETTTPEFVEFTLPTGQTCRMPLADYLRATNAKIVTPTAATDDADQTADVIPITAAPPRPPMLTTPQTIAHICTALVPALCAAVESLRTAEISKTRQAEDINKRGLYHALNVFSGVVRGLHNLLREKIADEVANGYQPLDVSFLKDYVAWFVLSMEELAANRSRDVPLLALDEDVKKFPAFRLQRGKALNEVRWTPTEAATPTE